jgi:S-DNA-T family DNA segregation ATPase FtsK/SpoIIIE
LGKTLEKERLVKKLTEVFQSVGLKNNLGKMPNFIFDRPLDEVTRKLRLTRATLPLETFQKAKNSLESALQIYIDEIKEERAKGTVDIIYAHKAMPEIFTLKDVSHIPKLEFIVGTTRSQEMRANLNQVPHLLVAGQTGGGKSTFLRQLITALYLNDKKSTFTLIDLKGGLEFQTFENLPRITVVPGVSEATFELKGISATIEARMKLLRANKCKDVVEYAKLPPDERKDADGVPKDTALNRHLIVVDEAAEMFLAGHHASTSDVTAARRILSQVARQGRSIGVHLVIATQRPDSRALDPQVKANLTGVLCFQMVNDISSITVLGTGRATDLPPIPGRAIWKSGMDTVEVQTPFLSTTEAEKLLDPLRVTPTAPVVPTGSQAPAEKPEFVAEDKKFMPRI